MGDVEVVFDQASAEEYLVGPLAVHPDVLTAHVRERVDKEHQEHLVDWEKWVSGHYWGVLVEHQDHLLHNQDKMEGDLLQHRERLA